MYHTCHVYLYDVSHLCKITYKPYGINIHVIGVSQLRHTYQSHSCACMHVAGGLTVLKLLCRNIWESSGVEPTVQILLTKMYSITSTC